MKRMEALEKKYQKIASKTTKELDGMSLSELMALRGNMRGWMEAVIAESGARGVVELDGMDRLPSLYDFAAVEFALRQVETEIAWRRKDPLKDVPFVSLSNAEIEAMTPEHPLYKLVKGDRKCKDE